MITLSSDSDESEEMSEESEDSSDVMMVGSSEESEEEDPEDVNNGGAHIDDTVNLPDAEGRVKVNLLHPEGEPDIYLAPQIAQSIKPHQVRQLFLLYFYVVAV